MNFPSLVYDEDKNCGDFLVLDFRKWRHVKTIYEMNKSSFSQRPIKLNKHVGGVQFVLFKKQLIYSKSNERYDHRSL